MTESTTPFDTDSILDVQPMSEGNWTILTKDGICTLNDPQIFQSLDLSNLNLSGPIALRISNDRHFAVVAEEYGNNALVANLQSGQTTMHLTRGDYHTEHCSFSVAFFERERRTLLVHATDWNRLDISDPLTGKCLTERPSPSPKYKRHRPLPDHYLDYFRCRLSISPDQKRIFDNGWVWHPMGIPRVWSLHAWLGNVWESEDGDSVRELQTGGEMWDAPMAWVDDQTVIVWGLGEAYSDDDLARPGIRIFDISTGEEKMIIETVDVKPSQKHPREPASEGWIAFDKWLYAVSPKNGTTVWDIETGQCIRHEPHFTPRRYNLSSKTFLSLEPNLIRISKMGD